MAVITAPAVLIQLAHEGDKIVQVAAVDVATERGIIRAVIFHLESAGAAVIATDEQLNQAAKTMHEDSDDLGIQVGEKGD